MASSFETHRHAMLLRMRSSKPPMAKGVATPRVSNHGVVECAIMIHAPWTAQKNRTRRSCLIVIDCTTSIAVEAVMMVVMVMMVVSAVSRRHYHHPGRIPRIEAMVVMMMMMVVVRVIELSKLDIFVR